MKIKERFGMNLGSSPSTKVANSSNPANVGVAGAPNEERIRVRAYEIFQARAGKDEPGDPLSDWFKAEHDLRQHAVGIAIDGDAVVVRHARVADGGLAAGRDRPAGERPAA